MRASRLREVERELLNNLVSPTRFAHYDTADPVDNAASESPLSLVTPFHSNRPSLVECAANPRTLQLHPCTTTSERFRKTLPFFPTHS